MTIKIWDGSQERVWYSTACMGTNAQYTAANRRHQNVQQQESTVTIVTHRQSGVSTLMPLTFCLQPGGTGGMRLLSEQRASVHGGASGQEASWSSRYLSDETAHCSWPGNGLDRQSRKFTGATIAFSKARAATKMVALRQSAHCGKQRSACARISGRCWSGPKENQPLKGCGLDTLQLAHSAGKKSNRGTSFEIDQNGSVLHTTHNQKTCQSSHKSTHNSKPKKKRQPSLHADEKKEMLALSMSSTVVGNVYVELRMRMHQSLLIFWEPRIRKLHQQATLRDLGRTICCHSGGCNYPPMLFFTLQASQSRPVKNEETGVPD